MKVISGVSTPEPAPGEKWTGGEVQAGLEVLKFEPKIDPTAVAKAQQIRQVLMDRLDALKKRYEGQQVDGAKLADLVRNAVRAALMEEGMDDGEIDVQVHNGRLRVRIQGSICGMPFNFVG
mgnify:CR=1 FL=1